MAPRAFFGGAEEPSLESLAVATYQTLSVEERNAPQVHPASNRWKWVWMAGLGGGATLAGLMCWKGQQSNLLPETRSLESDPRLLERPDDSNDTESCNSRFEVPEPGSNALYHNGVWLPDTCIKSEGVHQVFIIGDWGGIDSGDHSPVPADHRKEGVHKRDFVDGLDDRAQLKVRDVMRWRAATAPPEYILNVGDNFYWGGVEAQCGSTRSSDGNFSFSPQWDHIYEGLYTGEGLDGKQWLGVLGNHDYGGYLYSNGWDQAILYTWSGSGSQRQGRWVTPAQYYRSTVRYNDFSVDYFFLDTNIFDVQDPFENLNNNICSFAHNPVENGSGDCTSEAGPSDVFDCQEWFQQLWDEQLDWLHLQLSNSSADWQIVVTHFPPTFDEGLFANLSKAYGIDLFVTGHLHRQEVHGNDDSNFLAPTVWVVSGGGGGITSDFMPHVGGDSQYGFMTMTLSRDSIEVVNVMHNGLDGDRAFVSKRPCSNCTKDHIKHNQHRIKQGLADRGGRVADHRSTTITATSTVTETGLTSTNTTTETVTSVSSTTTSTTALLSALEVHIASAGSELISRGQPEGMAPANHWWVWSGLAGVAVSLLALLHLVLRRPVESAAVVSELSEPLGAEPKGTQDNIDIQEIVEAIGDEDPWQSESCQPTTPVLLNYATEASRPADGDDRPSEQHPGQGATVEDEPPHLSETSQAQENVEERVEEKVEEKPEEKAAAAPAAAPRGPRGVRSALGRLLPWRSGVGAHPRGPSRSVRMAMGQDLPPPPGTM